MSNSLSYWRASHPLVYISFHLMIGLALAYSMPMMNDKLALYLSLIIYASSIILLLILNEIKNIHAYAFMSISLLLIFWGMAIKWSFQNKTLFTIPYPEAKIQLCRNWVIDKVSGNISDEEAKGFALSLLLGIKAEVNKNLMNAYTQLGIIHIIAISGMHLEILFKNLTKMTQLLPRNILFLWLELWLLLLSVWTYALMALGTPSIIRATVFFSIYIIGKFVGASHFVLNVIAGGILILLLFDSHKVTHIGLQLSYAAVIGIQVLYKPMYNAITLENPLIKFLWGNCCVSLAAQITTFPILAFHFHQISGWVLVSNFIMVPLSNIILYGLGILLILPNYGSIASLWGNLIEKYIHFFNKLVTDWFTQTNTENVMIQLDYFDLILYYLIVISLYLWLHFKNTIYLLWVLSAICLQLSLKLFS